MWNGMPPTPPPDSIMESELPFYLPRWTRLIIWPAIDGIESDILLDLTGKVVKEGYYAVAHGGFSDVWKALWHKGTERSEVCLLISSGPLFEKFGFLDCGTCRCEGPSISY